MLAYVHMPKAGGTTMAGILRRSFGARHCDVEPIAGRRVIYGSADHRLTASVYPRLQSIGGHQVSPASDLDTACPEIFYYTMFREPVARLASAYQYMTRIGNPPDFETMIGRDWLQDHQTRLLSGRPPGSRPDLNEAVAAIHKKEVLVGFVDEFDEFLVMLKLASGSRALDIRYERRNVAPENRLAKDLQADPKALSLLQEANRTDLELYRHVRQEIYPKQKARFPRLGEEVARFRAGNRPPFFSTGEFLNRAKRNLFFKPALRKARRLRASGPS